MRSTIHATVCGALLAAAPLFAQTATDHAAHHQATPAAPSSEGEVRKVDKSAAKLTIRHGEIKNLDMPAMTMVFQVKDPAMLDKVKQGDRIKFSVEKVGGAYTVTALEVVQ